MARENIDVTHSTVPHRAERGCYTPSERQVDVICPSANIIFVQCESTTIRQQNATKLSVFSVTTGTIYPEHCRVFRSAWTLQVQLLRYLCWMSLPSCTPDRKGLITTIYPDCALHLLLTPYNNFISTLYAHHHAGAPRPLAEYTDLSSLQSDTA